MKVTINNYTHNPMKTISEAAGICYNKKDYSEKRVERCFKNGHLSVFEHASVSFLVEGISRACSHQLVRHRLASYSQGSQRYVKGWPGNVIPLSIESNEKALDAFMNALFVCQNAYKAMIDECGIPAEDARYILPNSAETSLVVTMNWRELFHFLDLRTDKAAQWEIRELAFKMIEQLHENDETEPLIEMWENK